MNSIFHTFKADFHQRVRQQSYLVTLLSMAVLTMIFFSSLDESYQTVQINNYRGMYNSAWIGVSLAMLNFSFLPLICFYIIKGTIERDRAQQVGELIASTQIKKLQYMLGKWLSNLCLLLGILICMSLTVIFVQLWHGEDYSINVFHLILPQLVYVAPMLIVVASVAILLESVPILRGGVVNIVYFFLWSVTLVQSMFGVSGTSDLKSQMLQGFVVAEIGSAQSATDIGVEIGVEIEKSLQICITVSESTLNTFYWQGLDYSVSSWLPILQMLIVALVLLMAAIVFLTASNKRLKIKSR